MRELFAEFGAGEIVDFAVGLVGSWRHFFVFLFSFVGWVWVGFEVGWMLCSGGLVGCCGFVVLGFE